MKKTLTMLSVIFLAIVLMVFFIYQNRDILKNSPFKSSFLFENLSCAVPDARNNLYLIDKSKKRIVRIDSAGKLEYIIQRESNDNNAISLFNDMVSDNSGFLYVLISILDSQGYYVQSEEIVRYQPDGDFDRVMYRVDYPENKRPIRTGHLKALKIKDDALYFYSVEQSNVLLNRLDLDGNDITNVFNVPLPENIYLADIVGMEKGSIYYSTKKGKIYRINSLEQSELVYSGDSNKSLPVYLGIDSRDRVYFADLGSREVNRLNSGEALWLDNFLSEKKVDGQGYDIPLTDLKSIHVRKDGSAIMTVSDRVFGVRPDGQIYFVAERARYSPGRVFYGCFVWLLALCAAGLLIYACRIIYVDVMGQKVSLMLKQIVVFVPIIVISMMIISGMVYKSFSVKFENEMYGKLKMLAYLAPQLIDGDRLEKITMPDHYMNPDYNAIRNRIDFMFQEQAGVNAREFYGLIYKVEGGQLYACVSDDGVSPYYPLYYDDDDKYFNVFKTGQIITDKSSDTEGDWIYSIGPLYNSAGKIVGLYETGMDLNSFNEQNRVLFGNIGKGILIMAVIIVVVFALTTYFLLLSIRTLRNGVNEVADGNWDTVVSVGTRDEVADLCDGFNAMAANIRNYITKITNLSESYFRFVPQQFLEFLGKSNIMDVQLGDQVKQEMSIMFSNIRSFYVLSETMTPEESFNFINSFLGRIGPVIRNSGGFINRYLGAGVMALFPGKTADALHAAVEMRKELDIYNGHRIRVGYEPIEIGIGMHKGPLMLGVVGEEKRLEGTVISDSVNLAAAIEKLTQKLGASILITEDILQDIENPEQYQHRFLGLVRVEGKEEPVRIYDIYQGDPAVIRKLKQETKGLFEEGIMLYHEGRFYDARNRFVEVIKYNHWDEAAKIYFFLSDDYFKKGAPEGWSGALSAEYHLPGEGLRLSS